MLKHVTMFPVELLRIVYVTARATKVLCNLIFPESSRNMKERCQDEQFFFSADLFEKESTPHADFVYPEIDRF